MKKIITLSVFAVMTLIACDTKITIPPNAHICHNDYDCDWFAGEYCGFQSPYTAAVCKK